MDQTQATNAEFKETLRRMRELFDHSVVHIYGYVETNGDEKFFRVSIANQPVVLPRGKDPLPADAVSINIWGDVVSSSVTLNNSKYNCLFVVQAVATMLTIIGYEVYVNDKVFDPEEGVEWRAM